MIMNKITLSNTIYNQLVEHGKSCLPYEACGLLAGNKDDITSIWPLENEWKSDRRFFVSEKIVAQTLNEIKARNELVIAVYHSHPTTAPVPSRFDLINHPDEKVKMVIVSYKNAQPSIKTYVINKENYKECPFLIRT